MAKKVKKVRFAKLQATCQKAAKNIPVIMDVANKVWVLTVTFTLWGSAYVVYACSEANVPIKAKQLLAVACFTLGLMFLFANLGSKRPGDMIE